MFTPGGVVVYGFSARKVGVETVEHNNGFVVRSGSFWENFFRQRHPFQALDNPDE
jgi:hypothetical protein